MTGWSEGEVLGNRLRAVFRMLDEKSREVIEDPVAGLNGDACTTAKLLVARDGSEIPIHAGAAPIRNGRGDVLGAVVISATPRRRAKPTRRSARARSVLPDRQYRQRRDLGGGCLRPHSYVNWRLAEMLGCSAEEMTGRPLHDFAQPDDRSSAARFMARLKQGISEQRDYALRRKDGTNLWVLAGTSPIQDEEGRFLGALAMVTDVTDRKRLEEELRRRADELAESGRRKDEFLAMLAHELRNPLGAVRNALAIIRSTRASEDARCRAMGVVERQVRHQVRMVDDLLDVSRITRGRVELRHDLVNIARVVRDAAEDHRDNARNAHLDLTVTLPQEPVWVKATPRDWPR